MGLEKAPKARTKAPRKLPKLTNEEKRRNARKVLAKLPSGKKAEKKPKKKEKTVKALTPEQKAKKKKLEKMRFVRQFRGVSRLFEKNGMRMNVEASVETYLSTPKNKKVPVATIQTSMSGLFSSADTPETKKELMKNKGKVQAILKLYCQGNLVTAQKKLRTLKGHFEFVKKCHKDFEEVDMVLGKHGLKLPKGYIEAYIKLPKGKGIPIKTIKANLDRVLKIAMKIWKTNNSHIPEGILPLSEKYGKLPPRPGGMGYPVHKPLLDKADTFSIYSVLGYYCNGAKEKGNKILKRLEEKQKYLEKIEGVMKKDVRLKRFGYDGINRIFTALIQSGVPKTKVFDVFTKEFDAIKKLDEINMSELSNSMPNQTYMELLVGAILARRGGQKEKANELIKRKILIESTHIRNVRELESKKDQRTHKIALEIADLEKYQKENPDVGFDKTILKHKKKITKLQLERNTYESLLLLCDMTKFMATKYLEKKTTDPASEATIANISAYMNAYKTSPFNYKKNLQDLKFFSADVKVPIPPTLSIYHAIIAEKELIKLNGPSKMFDNSDLGELFIECQDGFLKTGKLDKSTVEKQAMLDLLQNKASRAKERQNQVVKLAKSHKTYFDTLSANHKDINSLPPEKREEVSARLIGYVSILNTVRKLDAKYYEICKDFKFTLMLGAPKGAKPEDVLKKIGSYKHSFKKGKDLTYRKVTYKLNNFTSYTRGYLEDADKTPLDFYKNKILKVYGFLRLRGKLPKLNELAGSDILQPIIKAELSPTFDAIEKLYSKGGDVAEAQRKINAVGLKMQNDRKFLPETMMANSFDTCLGFYDNAITRLTRANKTIENQRNHLKKLLDSDAIFKKYKNRPEIAKKITVAIKLTKKKLLEMEMDGKSLVSLDGIGRAMDARNKLKANRDKYIKHKFYEGMVTAGMLVVAVGTAMVGGSAFAALGTRLFARVASAALQKALVTTFTMAGASAGGVVGARGFQSFAQYAGMADFGGYGKIWNRKRMKRDFAIGFLLSMGAVTAGRGLMAGLERGAVSKFGWVSRLSGKGLDKMKTVGKILSPDEWFQSKGALTDSALKRYGMRVGGETVQEGFEEAMERVHPVAGFLASVGSCSRSPNIELALHGIRAGDIGIKTEGRNFVYTTATGKEFARNIKREFNTKTDQTVETQVDPDGTVFLHLKKKYRNKKGEVINKRYSTIKVRPARRSKSLSPEAEIARIEGLEKDRPGVYKVQDAKTALVTTRELKTRGFIVTENEKGNLTVVKGEFTFELKISEQTAESIAKEKKGAMAYLKGNLASIRAKLKKPNIKKAFVAFMIKSQGNLTKFREKYPTLAKILPKDLLKLRLIPVPVVGMSCGITFDFKSLGEFGVDKDFQARTKFAETLKKAGLENEAVAILSMKAFLGTTGHPVRTLPEIKTAVEQLIEFKKLEGSLISLGLNQQFTHIQQGYMLDESIPQTGGFDYKLMQARALVETHQQLLKIQGEVMELCPSLKGPLGRLTDYSAKSMDTHPTFASRLGKAQKTLMLAKQFKGSDIPLQEYSEVSDFLRQHDTQDALTDILLKYGDDIDSTRSSKNAEWNALLYKIEGKFPSIKSASLQKVLFNELYRLKAVYDQSILKSTPIDTKTTLEQRVMMAEFFKEFAELKIDTKHALKPKEIIQEVFKKNPELKKKLTSKQLKLIESKLGELGRHYTEVNRIRSMTPEQKRAYVVGKIKEEYPNFEIPANLQFNIKFGGATGSSIFIDFSHETFVQMEYSHLNPGKKWSSLPNIEQQKILAYPPDYGITPSALNMVGNIVFVNKGLYQNKAKREAMEMHEDVHTFTFLSGAKDSPKWTETHYEQLLKQGKYNEFIKLRFQEEFTGVCDEIVAKIIDGTPQNQIMRGFEYANWDYYTKNILPRIPVEHRHKVAGMHAKAYREFRTMFKRTLYFGEKIKSYPNGENILRFTPPHKWRAMYKHLKGKHGYDVLAGNIEQTLPVAKEAVYKCRSGNLYIYAGNKRHDIVKDDQGYALVRNGQYIDLPDGKITDFKARPGAPTTMEIRVDGDRIFITNLSNKPMSVEAFETPVELKAPKESPESIELREKLRKEIKEEIDWMRECGYTKEAAIIGNYSGKEYPTLEKRFEAAKKITAELDALNAAGIQFTYKDGKNLVEILRFRSKGGKSLKSLFEKYQKAQISRDTKTINAIHNRLAKGFQIFFGRRTKQMIPKILQLGISRLPRLKKNPIEVLRGFDTLSKETTLRKQGDYEKSLNAAVETLRGQPGIVRLNKNIETLIIPDLHARRSELVKILAKKGPDGKTNLEKMQNGQLQIVVLGDGMHAEGRAKTRWQQATNEVMDDAYGRSKSMDAEMVESLGVMKMIMELKTANPKMFHYLKGNHDNITDRKGGGDIPFGKYSMAGEGQMVKRWVQRNYGEGFLNKWAQFEQSLPIMAIGNNFVASHAEPGNFLFSTVQPKKTPRKAIFNLNDVNNRTPEAVEALTWSRTKDCKGNQADVFLRMAGLDPARAKYIVGHSPTKGQKYVKLENGVIVINDAADLKYARIKANGKFNPDVDIHNVSEKPIEVAKPADVAPKDRTNRQGVAKNKGAAQEVAEKAAEGVAKGVAKIDWGNF